MCKQTLACTKECDWSRHLALLSDKAWDEDYQKHPKSQNRQNVGSRCSRAYLHHFNRPLDEGYQEPSTCMHIYLWMVFVIDSVFSLKHVSNETQQLHWQIFIIK